MGSLGLTILEEEELDIDKVYRRRFGDQLTFRDAMWRILCREYFQQFIPSNSRVLDIAAGYCEFINNIRAERKIALEINPDAIKRADKNVEVILSSSDDLSMLGNGSIDRIFASNFFEHIHKEQMVRTLQESRRVLSAGGQILILQPNIRYVYKDYWMFFDHINPVDDRALCEILEVVGFSIKLDIPRFLPFTTESRVPKSLGLLRLYLKIPILWKFFGGQAFVVAEK